MKKKEPIRIVYWGVVLIVYILAVKGYILAGEPWYDATYYAFLLFGMEYASEVEANGLLCLCRVMCPILAATGVLALARNLRAAIKIIVNSMYKDATAIYYDDDVMEQYGKAFLRPVMMKNVVNRKVKSHVLLFREDMDNFTFYEQLKDHIAPGSKVYFKLDKVESRLLEKSDVYYFNMNEIIARRYWKERTLEKYISPNGLKIRIGIIGFGTLGKNLLDYGLMNNIYGLKQRIEYHIWGDAILYKHQMRNLNMMNEDTITYHDVDWREELEALKECDRIIVAEEPDIEIVQALLHLNCGAELDVYNPAGIDFEKIYVGGMIKDFGVFSKILTEDNIKTDKLYRRAKEINYDYVVNSDIKQPPEGREVYTWESPNREEWMQKSWDALSGFVKGSNVASADYHEIRLLVMREMGMDKDKLTVQELEQLAEMEHIRWCRYHYVNHWEYDEDRDNMKRLHPLLKLYAKLDNEMEKDRNAVRGLLLEREE